MLARALTLQYTKTFTIHTKHHKVAQSTATWHKVLQGSTRLVLWYYKIGKKCKVAQDKIQGNLNEDNL